MCEVRLDSAHLATDVPECATLEKWLVPEGTMLEADTRLATISCDVLLYALHTRFRCMLWSTGAQEGDTIQRGELIAQIAADSGDVPEGTWYCVLKPFAVPG